MTARKRKRNPTRRKAPSAVGVGYKPIESTGSRVVLDAKDIRDALGLKRGQTIPVGQWSGIKTGIPVTGKIEFEVSFDDDGFIDGVSSRWPTTKMAFQYSTSWHVEITINALERLKAAAAKFDAEHRQ